MSKKDYALVSVLGTITFSDVVKYENKKELQNYFVMITEK